MESAEPPPGASAARRVLAAARAVGCDTRVGAVAFCGAEGALALHLPRLQAAARVWPSTLTRAELRAACAAFARARPAAPGTGAVLLAAADLAQLRQAGPPAACAGPSGSAVVRKLLRQRATAPALTAPGQLPWGEPVPADCQLAQTILGPVRAALGLDPSPDYHVATGGRSTWQRMRTRAELAADARSWGSDVEALEVDVGGAVSRPPFVLRPPDDQGWYQEIA